MTHFTSPETDGNLYLVTVLQELDSVVELGVEIVSIDVERKTNFLGIDNLLILAGFLFPFACSNLYLP